MREETSLDAINGENKTERQDQGWSFSSLVVAHLVLLLRARAFICHSIWMNCFYLATRLFWQTAVSWFSWESSCLARC